ncbi:MAG: hypothetical protein LUC41_04285 [Clostridiales bacterium]|nr:hypothetical protein [Clostridiales bacterium]
MSVKNTEEKRGLFGSIRRYYRNNVEYITMAWAGLYPSYAEYNEILRKRS